MKEDHRSYRRNCKRLSFPSCKGWVYNCDDLPPYNSSPLSSHIWFSYIHNFIRKQFHSVNGTEISHMKKSRDPKSLSARLVFKHCEHLCVGIYSEEREKHGAAWNNRIINKASLLKNPLIIISGYLLRFFLKLCKCFLRNNIKFFNCFVTVLERPLVYANLIPPSHYCSKIFNAFV